LAQYYYVVSSLPLIFYDSKVKIGIDDFLEVCKNHLSGDDFELLEFSDLKNIKKRDTDCDFLKKWYSWELSLRNELVKLRAGSPEEAEKYLVEVPVISGLQALALRAFEEDSPLNGEDILGRARWAVLDELETGHYFDIEKLISFYLKLQILKRKNSFRREEGFARYKEIYKIITEKKSEEPAALTV